MQHEEEEEDACWNELRASCLAKKWPMLTTSDAYTRPWAAIVLRAICDALESSSRELTIGLATSLIRSCVRPTRTNSSLKRGFSLSAPRPLLLMIPASKYLPCLQKEPEIKRNEICRSFLQLLKLDHSPKEVQLGRDKTVSLSMSISNWFAVSE